MSDYQPVPVFEKHAAFLRSVVELLFKTVVFGVGKESKLILWKDPEELKTILDMKVAEDGVSHAHLLKLIETTIKYSVKTGHPYFINQLFSGLDAYGLAAQWVTDALNASVYTYEVAPVFTLMEQEVLKEFCMYVGYEQGDGVFCPGGSLANGIALNVARFHYYPAVKKTGASNTKKLIIFTSEEAHYSIQKMASFQGIGESNVIEIKTDNLGRMIPSNLEEQIQHHISLGNLPYVVVATLGTTVRGAFDPINEMAEICKKYKLWLHADAAWGGGLIFSKKHRHMLDGINKTNSITINPHKLLAVPQQCSMLLVKEGDLLKKCHSKEAQYLFQKDKFYDISYDTGDKYIQCGRKCDVFKFYLMWKAKGSNGFEKHIDAVLDTASYLTKRIKESDEFKLVSEPQFINVCFWFLPPSLRTCDVKDKDYNTKLSKICPRLKEIFMKDGHFMINYQPLKKLPNFFRYVSQNSAFDKTDVDNLLKYMSEKGKDL